MIATCAHMLGNLPCTSTVPLGTTLHKGDGAGCTHEAGSWVPDRHDKPGRGDGE